MSQKQKINIVLFTNNLRVRDNESLYKAMQDDLPFLAVYIFDPQFFRQTALGARKIGPHRAKFLVESVQDLQQSLTDKHIPFVVKVDDPARVFGELKTTFDITKIFCQYEWTAEEMECERRITACVPNAHWVKSYSQFLIDPQLVFSTFHKIPNSFTTFRTKIEKHLVIRQEFASAQLHYTKAPIVVKSDDITLSALGIEMLTVDKRTAFPFAGGEATGLSRMAHYFSSPTLIGTYKETRNGLVGLDYSSKFSAWLANGSLSAVSIYHELKKYEQHFGSNASSYWLIFELYWRDFFKYVSLQHGDQIFQKDGINHLNYKATINSTLITQWKEGKTSCDFVNANMVELKETGWMSNRGRQNVASYFCKTLRQDWRYGAAYFEEMLIDYDVHSNYGNWMYVAGVGNDSRDRYFNTRKQAEMYDPNYEFRRLWLQE